MAEDIEGNVEVHTTDDVPAFDGEPAGTLDVGVDDESEDYSDMFGDDEEPESSIADFEVERPSDVANSDPQEVENAEEIATLLPDAGIASIATQAQEWVASSPEVVTSSAKVAAAAPAGGLMSRLFGWVRRKQPADTQSADGVITNLNEQVAAASEEVIEMPSSLENQVDPQAATSADADGPENANESFQLDAPMAVGQTMELDSDDADDNFDLFGSVDESVGEKKSMSSRETLPDPQSEAASGIVEAFSDDDLEVSTEVASTSQFSSADTLRDPVSHETDDEDDFSVTNTSVVETKLKTDEVESASVATEGSASESRFEDQRELELTSKIDELSAENATLSQTVNSLQAKVEEADASLLEMANLAKQFEAGELEHQDLLASLESTKTELESTKTELEVTKTELESIKTELEVTKSETATQVELSTQVETELSELRENVATLESENDNLSSQLAEAKSSLAEKDTVLAKNDAVVAEKDSLLAEKDALLLEKDAALAEKDSLLAEKDSILADKDAVLAEKQSALAQQEAKLEAELNEASSLEVADLKRRFEMRLKAERKARKDAQFNLEQAEEQRNDIALALRAAKKDLAAAKEAIAETSKPESS